MHRCLPPLHSLTPPPHTYPLRAIVPLRARLLAGADCAGAWQAAFRRVIHPRRRAGAVLNARHSARAAGQRSLSLPPSLPPSLLSLLSLLPPAISQQSPAVRRPRLIMVCARPASLGRRQTRRRLAWCSAFATW
eukprot:8695-Rhodomonas_salina.1